MTTTPKLDMEQARAICEAATEGPWRHNPAAARGAPMWRVEYTAKGMNRGASFVIADCEGTEGNDVANARFIAAARTALPLALDRIEALEKECAALTKLVVDAANSLDLAEWHKAASRIRDRLAAIDTARIAESKKEGT